MDEPMPVFDAYLMADWSANSRPKTGADSIWYCLAVRERSTLLSEPARNPPTRHEAIGEIRAILSYLTEQGLRILVGFDFAYAYPAGFAARLGLQAPDPWKTVWELLADTVRDEADNLNNRFEVASLLNERMTGRAAPFWACPPSQANHLLRTTKPRAEWPEGLEEYRCTERRTRGTQSVWKLYTPGSVGSQALLGIPYVHSLRYDSELASVSRVWPFETGFHSFHRQDLHECRILHAEVYPSLFYKAPVESMVKDEAQVKTLAAAFAAMDETGELSELLDRPSDLTDEEAHIARIEEGWILGVR